MIARELMQDTVDEGGRASSSDCGELITGGTCQEEPELNADSDHGLEDTTIAATRRE